MQLLHVERIARVEGPQQIHAHHRNLVDRAVLEPIACRARPLLALGVDDDRRAGPAQQRVDQMQALAAAGWRDDRDVALVSAVGQPDHRALHLAERHPRTISQPKLARGHVWHRTALGTGVALGATALRISLEPL